jgi:hypothetical protein
MTPLLLLSLLTNSFLLAALLFRKPLTSAVEPCNCTHTAQVTTHAVGAPSLGLHHPTAEATVSNAVAKAKLLHREQFDPRLG